MTKNKNIRLVTKSRIAFDTASKREYDSVNGYLRVADNPFTREQVTQYRGREIPEGAEHGLIPEKYYNVYRPASELSKPETIASLKEIPLLLEHETFDPLDPPKERIIGNAGSNPTWEAPYLKNSLTFHDAKAIHLLESGAMKELSLGYYYKPVFKKGKTKDGQDYDVIMTNIRANHIALVEEGRAGPDVAVHDSKPKQSKEGSITMEKDENMTTADNGDTIQTLLNLVIGLAKQNGIPVPDNNDDVIEDDDDEQMQGENEEQALEDDEQALDDDEQVQDDDDEQALDDDDEQVQDDDDEQALDNDDEQAQDDDDEQALDDDESTNDSDLSDDEIAAVLKESGLTPNEGLIEGIRLALNALSKKSEPIGDSKRSLRSRITNAYINSRVDKRVAKFRALDKAKIQAAREVRGVLGNVDALAYDSAGSIYKKALRKSGYTLKEVKGMKSSEARACFRGLSRGKASKQVMAKDTAKSKSITNAAKSFNLLLQKIK